MKSIIRHPVVVFGAIICIIGWFWLIFGVTASKKDVGTGLFLWSVKIAETVIWSGFFLVIAGVLMAGFETIRSTLIYHPEIASGEEYSKRKQRARKRIGRPPQSQERGRPAGTDGSQRHGAIEDWLGK